MIGVDYDRASLRQGARQHVGVEDSQERPHESQRTQYLRRVHFMMLLFLLCKNLS